MHSKHLENIHKAKLVYGDTDSTYVYFPEVKGAKNLWNHALNVEQEVSSLFPRPMKLAFEEKIYWRYFILTKKRYKKVVTKCRFLYNFFRHLNSIHKTFFFISSIYSFTLIDTYLNIINQIVFLSN